MTSIHLRYLVAAIALAAAAQMQAANLKFLPGKTNWADPASYSTDIWHDNKPATALPGANDVVFVMGSDQITVDASDSASWAAINGIGRISFWTNEGTFIVNVPSGSANLSTPVCYSTFNREINRHRGWLVKTGAGELHLTGTGNWCYEVKIVARAGDLYLQQDITSENVYYSTLAVSNNATIHMPTWSANAPKVGWCHFGGFDGDGTIAASKSITCYAEGNVPTVFAGTLSENIGVFWGSPQTLLTDHARSSVTLVSYDYETWNATNDSCLAVMHIGAPNEPSPLGTNGTINVGLNSGGGGLRYLGSGETVTKTISVNHSTLSPAIIDGGPNGNLVWNGTIKHNAFVPQMHRVEFRGDNANPCTFGGAMTTDAKSGTNYSFYVTKAGTGTWRFTDNASRNWRGGLAVEGGTFQFDSLDDAGYVSALGYADWLYTRETVLRSPANETPYAFALGNPDGDGDIVFEYTGSGTSRATTRQTVLKGDVHIRNNTSSAFRLHGISAFDAGEKVLTLDGSGEGGNDIFNVTDGAGKVSVVKDGPGTWFLGGTNSFSGSLSVKAGTLYVRDPAKYTFYRWNIMQTLGTFYMVRSRAFGLFDANGNRLNANLKEGGRRGILAPGEAGYDHDRWFAYEGDNTTLTNLFCDTCSFWGTYGKTGKTSGTTTISATEENTSSWIVVQMRLPNGCADVASYDFAILGKSDGWYKASIGIWSVEASADGVSWDEVVPRQTNPGLDVPWHYRWASDGTTYCTNRTDTSVHTTGMAIAGRKTTGIAPSLNNVSTVSVSPGAALTTDAGSGLTISALSIPASDADAAVPGVISNFTLATSGTIAVTGLESSSPRDFTLKVDVSGCANASAIAGWSVSLDGGAAGRYKTVLSADGTVRVFRPGMMFTIR